MTLGLAFIPNSRTVMLLEDGHFKLGDHAFHYGRWLRKLDDNNLLAFAGDTNLKTNFLKKLNEHVSSGVNMIDSARKAYNQTATKRSDELEILVASLDKKPEILAIHDKTQAMTEMDTKLCLAIGGVRDDAQKRLYELVQDFHYEEIETHQAILVMLQTVIDCENNVHCGYPYDIRYLERKRNKVNSVSLSHFKLNMLAYALPYISDRCQEGKPIQDRAMAILMDKKASKYDMAKHLKPSLGFGIEFEKKFQVGRYRKS